MGNFLFRTGSYRRAKAIEKQQAKTNELLGKLVAQQQPTAAPGSYLASDGRYYSADGRFVWDGAAWRPLS